MNRAAEGWAMRLAASRQSRTAAIRKRAHRKAIRWFRIRAFPAGWAVAELSVIVDWMRPGRSCLHEPGTSRPLSTGAGLLRSRGCANLDFCAVERAERECVRAASGWISGFCLGLREFSPGVGWAGVAQLVEHL